MNYLSHLAPNVIYTFGGLFGLLSFSSFFVRVFSAVRPMKNRSELVSRIRSWWVIVAIFALAIAGNKQTSILFLAFVSYLALKEYLSLIPVRVADRRILFWAYLSIPIQFFWISIGWYPMFLIFIPVYLFLFIPLRMVTIGETKGFLAAAGMIHWGVMMTVFSLSHIAYLMVLPSEMNPAGGNAGWVLFLIMLTELNDVSQFVWGKTFGKNKIIPKVSPNKTVEGFVGGVVTTTLLSVLISPYLTPFTLRESIFVGLIFSCGGFFGDVVVSAIKRDIGVKDAGSILPGHGGIMDRVDSLTYTAPLFFHFVKYFHY